jgi:hypothetical protein
MKTGKILVLCGMLFAPLTGAVAADFFAERLVTVKPGADECVGNVKDPLCVFDTVIACVIRDAPELCKKIGLKYDQTMKNTVGHLAGRDYLYRLTDMFVTRRTDDCANEDNKRCVYDPNGKVIAVDMSIGNDRHFSVFLRREKNGWSVIFATEFDCWSDEDCS